MEVKDYSIKGFKEKFKQQGIFYTPEELALFLKGFIDIPYKTAYDPTCGRGSLLSVLEDDIEKYGQELNETELEVAKNTLKNFTGVAGDTLKKPAFLEKKFDVILANPPFSIKWEPVEDDPRFTAAPIIPTASRADYAFLLHILYMLSEEGVAIVLNFPGILYRGQREGKIRKWFIDNNYIEKVVRIPKDTFIDTSIETCLLVIRKNKKSNQIEFIDFETNASYTASYEEVKENNYTLSISNYIIYEEVKEIVDPVDLELEIRRAFINNLKNTLFLSKMAYEFEKNEKLNINSFIEEIKGTANRYRD